MKKTKKIDVKKIAKAEVLAEIAKALSAIGYDVTVGEDYGFTASTVVVSTDKCDVQVKLITPKAGVDRYECLVDEEVEESAEATDAEAEVSPEEDPTAL